MSYLSKEFLAKYYAPLMTFQYIQLLYCCTSGACTDCFFFDLVLHLCAQLQRLGIEKKAGVVDHKIHRSEINELITKHKKLVKIGENLEASFNNVVLVQLMISIILICMSGCSVLASIMENDYVTMMISVNCISFMITESFIYGYASDYFLTQSESIVDAVYASGWYEFSNVVKKDIAFVMMRAQKPFYITAGKFFYVTRNTIIQLLKTTLSYLSVLRLTIEMSQANKLTGDVL